MQLIISQTARCEFQKYESMTDNMRRTNRDIQFIGIIYNGYVYVKKGVDIEWGKLQVSEIKQRILYLTRSRTNG